MKLKLWITNGVAVRFRSRITSISSRAWSGSTWGILFLLGILATEGSISDAQDFSLTEVFRLKDLVCMFDDDTLLWHRYSINDGAYLEPVSMESSPETIYKKGDTSSVCCRYSDGLLTELNLETGVETNLFVLTESYGLTFTEDLIIVSNYGFTVYTYDGTQMDPILAGEDPPSIHLIGYHGASRTLYYDCKYSRAQGYEEQTTIVHSRVYNGDGTWGEEKNLQTLEGSRGWEIRKLSPSRDRLATDKGVLSLVTGEVLPYPELGVDIDALDWIGESLMINDRNRQLFILDSDLNLVADFKPYRDISWEIQSPSTIFEAMPMDSGVAMVYWYRGGGGTLPPPTTQPYVFTGENLVILQFLNDQFEETGHSTLPIPPTDITFEINPDFVPYGPTDIPVGTFHLEDADGMGNARYVIALGNGFSIIDDKLYASEDVQWNFYKYTTPKVYVEMDVAAIDETDWAILRPLRIEFEGYPPLDLDSISLYMERPRYYSGSKQSYPPPYAGQAGPIPIGVLMTTHSTAEVQTIYSIVEDPYDNFYIDGRVLFAAGPMEAGNITIRIRADYGNSRILEEEVFFEVQEASIIPENIVTSNYVSIHPEGLKLAEYSKYWVCYWYPEENWDITPPAGDSTIAMRVSSRSGSSFTPIRIERPQTVETMQFKAVFGDGSELVWNPELDEFSESDYIAFPAEFESLRDLWVYSNSALLRNFTAFVGSDEPHPELSITVLDDSASPGPVTPSGTAGPLPEGCIEIHRAGSLLNNLELELNWSDAAMGDLISLSPTNADGHVIFPAGQDVLQVRIHPGENGAWTNGQVSELTLSPTFEYTVSTQSNAEFTLYASHFDLWKTLREQILEPADVPSEEEMHMRFLSGENPLELPGDELLNELTFQRNPDEIVLDVQFSRSLLYPEQVFVEKSGDLIHWEPASVPEEEILGNGEQREFVRQRFNFSETSRFYRLNYQMDPQ